MTTASPDRSDITVVPLQAEHAEAIHRIETLCFSLPWSISDIEALAADPRAVCVTALCGGEPIGYAGMYAILDEGMINNIAVDPQRRRSGIATALLHSLFAFCEAHGVRTLDLEVRASNEAAKALYEKEGFYPVGVRKNYYDDPREDALLYKKEIKCSTLQ